MRTVPRIAECRRPSGMPAPRRRRQPQPRLRASITPSSRTHFFAALEDSGSATRGDRLAAAASPRSRTPRAPCSACMPLLSESRTRYGEYVFDHGWADAYRARRRPLLSEAAGRGALHARHRPAPARARRRQCRAEREALLLAGRRASSTDRLGVSSLHVTFPTRDGMAARRRACGLLQRNDQQFHWQNDGYATLRRFPRRARLAQAQDDPARAPRGARRRHRDRMG